jgi:hypothetical protein
VRYSLETWRSRVMVGLGRMGWAAFMVQQ